MAHCSRQIVSAGTFFFTARLHDPQSDLLLREIGHLRAAFRAAKTRYPFDINAIVVLPAVIHTVWTLPPDDADYSARWSMLKALFSKGLPTPATRTQAQINRNDKGIWQPRFSEHRITDEQDLAAHIDFVHQAPVQSGLVARAAQWQHSSIHRANQPLTLRAQPSRAACAAQADLTGLDLPRMTSRRVPATLPLR